MNYLKQYVNLIRKAQNSNQNGYCELHHVFPKSIFGDNDYVVKLTAREHYVAHALLEKICITRYGKNDVRSKKMIYAFFMMNNVTGNGQIRYKNSRLFEASKIRFIEQVSGENSPFFGKKRTFSKEHLENLRSSFKRGEENPLYGKSRSEEIKQKLRKPKHKGHGAAVSASRKGIKFSDDHLKKLSEAHKGQIPWNKGKTLTEDQRKKLSEAQKNKSREYITEEYRKKLSEASKLAWAKRKNSKVTQ